MLRSFRRTAIATGLGLALSFGAIGHAPSASAKDKQVICDNGGCDVFERTNDFGGGWSTWSWIWRIHFDNNLHWV